MKVHPVSHTVALFYIFFSFFCINSIAFHYNLAPASETIFTFFVDRYLLELRIKIGSNGNLFYKHKNETMPQATKIFFNNFFWYKNRSVWKQQQHHHDDDYLLNGVIMQHFQQFWNENLLSATLQTHFFLYAVKKSNFGYYHWMSNFWVTK